MILQNTFDGLFKGKTVFVTGHTGFIGTWLSLWLCSLGAKVIGYSLKPPTNPSIFETVELAKQVTHIHGNVNDITHLQECLSKHKPEFVFHLAAQPLLRLSYEKPIETFQTNVMGTVNMLETIRKTPSVKVCIIMTSDKCYENRELDYAYRESDPLGGYDPYSASKGATELVTASYRNSFFNPENINEHKISVASVRAGNVIGGGDWAVDRILPDCVRSLILKEAVRVRHPNAIRPFQYILEPISGILCLAMKMRKTDDNYSEAWNFGPKLSTNKTKVKDLVIDIINEWEGGDWIDVSKLVNESQHEANSLILDSTKAMNSLGWEPVYSIKEAIAETIRWYRCFVDKNTEMIDLTLQQIQNYVKKAKQMNIPWADGFP